jgi:hypothetical protein
VAVLLLAYAAIPELIVYLVRGVVISAHIEASVFFLALMLFIFMRLCLVISLSEEGETAAVATLRLYAEAREEEMHDEAKLRGKDDIQLTIDDLFGEEVTTIPTDIEMQPVEMPDTDEGANAASDTEEE